MAKNSQNQPKCAVNFAVIASRKDQFGTFPELSRTIPPLAITGRFSAHIFMKVQYDDQKTFLALQTRISAAMGADEAFDFLVNFVQLMGRY